MNPKRNPDIRTTLLPDGYVVLVSGKTDWAHTLNPLGAIVWEFCDGDNSIEKVVEQVGRLVPEKAGPNLRLEVETLLDELVDSGLLTTSNKSVRIQ